jgi:outer membrane protein OmpA-like peptidoglycan-associated protein
VRIREALTARGPAQGAHDPTADRERGSDERRFLQALLKKKPDAITIDERREITELVSQKPNIDLEVTFEYNSATVGSEAVPTLVALGRALTSSELKGAVFVIAGHTDAAGSDSYNQSLSERRAEAVKIFLAKQFKLSPDQLLAIGFGRTQLKNAAFPLAPENRRVQIVNTGQ